MSWQYGYSYDVNRGVVPYSASTLQQQYQAPTVTGAAFVNWRMGLQPVITAGVGSPSALSFFVQGQSSVDETLFLRLPSAVTAAGKHASSLCFPRCVLPLMGLDPNMLRTSGPSACSTCLCSSQRSDPCGRCASDLSPALQRASNCSVSGQPLCRDRQLLSTSCISCTAGGRS